MTLAEIKAQFMADNDSAIPVVIKKDPMGRPGDTITTRPLSVEQQRELLAAYRKASDFSHAKQVRLFADSWVTGVYAVRNGGVVLFDSLSEGLAL